MLRVLLAAGWLVEGDASATATNILAHRSLFQLGFRRLPHRNGVPDQYDGISCMTCLSPRAESISILLGAFLGFAGCVIKTFGRVFFITPLVVLGGAHYLSVFSMEQLQARALLFLKGE